MAAEKKEREQRNSIGKGILAILLALFIIWLIFGFFGSFFAKSPERLSHYNTTKSGQIIPSIKTDPNSTITVPYSYKGQGAPLSHE